MKKLPNDYDEIRNSFGKRVEYYRKIKGYSQEKLASVLGLSRKTIGNWECNAKEPSRNNLEALAKALDVPVELLNGEIKMDPWIKDLKELQDVIREELAMAIFKILRFYGYDEVMDASDSVKAKNELPLFENKKCVVYFKGTAKDTIKGFDLGPLKNDFLYLSIEDVFRLSDDLIDYIWLRLAQTNFVNRGVMYSRLKGRVSDLISSGEKAKSFVPDSYKMDMEGKDNA